MFSYICIIYIKHLSFPTYYIIQKKIYIKKFLKDHRVFMTSVIAALTFGGSWNISDKDSVKTSFPSFIKKIKNLGAKIS